MDSNSTTKRVALNISDEIKQKLEKYITISTLFGISNGPKIIKYKRFIYAGLQYFLFLSGYENSDVKNEGKYQTYIEAFKNKNIEIPSRMLKAFFQYSNDEKVSANEENFTTKNNKYKINAGINSKYRGLIQLSVDEENILKYRDSVRLINQSTLTFNESIIDLMVLGMIYLKKLIRQNSKIGAENKKSIIEYLDLNFTSNIDKDIYDRVFTFSERLESI